MRKAQEGQSYHSTIGEWIKFNRQCHNKRQSDIAKIIGVTHQQINKYESGRSRISASALFTLAKHYNWPINTIFDKESWTNRL
jgi:transcriptional regulator with XRE-family HTH domain